MQEVNQYLLHRNHFDIKQQVNMCSIWPHCVFLLFHVKMDAIIKRIWDPCTILHLYNRCLLSVCAAKVLAPLI